MRSCADFSARPLPLDSRTGLLLRVQPFFLNGLFLAREYELTYDDAPGPEQDTPPIRTPDYTQPFLKRKL